MANHNEACASYNEALCTFRDLLDSDIDDCPSEYVRGGVNLIADLFGIVEMDVGTRMEQVEADLRRIPMYADPQDLERYGVAPYVHDPVNAYEYTAYLMVRDVKGPDEAQAKLDELIRLVCDGDMSIGVAIDSESPVAHRLDPYGAPRAD